MLRFVNGSDATFAHPTYAPSTGKAEPARLALWMLWGSVAAVILSVLDAYLTLNVLGRGATEANPVMSAVLDLGGGAFVVLKTAVTAFGAAILFRVRHLLVARTGMLAVVAAYVGLMCYHVYGQVLHARADAVLPL